MSLSIIAWTPNGAEEAARRSRERGARAQAKLESAVGQMESQAHG